MPKVNIAETTKINDKVFFPGEAALDEKDFAEWKENAEEPERLETVESLVKNNDRAALNERAQKAGLDGDSYTNKSELAQAILDAEK